MMRITYRTGLAPVVMLALLGSCWSGEEPDGPSDPDTLATPDSGDLPRYGLNPTRPLSQFTLSSWSSRDGLPQNSVQVIHQSADGYIWVGTQEGLVRFSGREFRIFDGANTPSIRNNHITSVVEADPNRLWIGTFGGGVVCLSTTGTACGTVDQGLSSLTISSLARDRQGGLWVGTDQDGLDYLFGDSIVTYTAADGLPANRISALLVDRGGAVWVGTSGGLSRISDGVVAASPVAALSQTGISALVEDAEGAVWVGTTEGLHRIRGDESRGFSLADGLLSDWVLSLYADATGTVLIGTTNGVNRYDRDGFSSYQLPGGRVGNLITTLLVDHEGSLWMGTATSGLHQLREAAITTYTQADGLTSDIVYAVHGSGAGGVWIGLYTGDVNLYQNGAFKEVLSASELGSGRLRTLYEDGLGSLWIGTETGLHVYAAGRIRTFTSEDGMPRVAVRVISEERDGTILVGTDGAGLYRVQNDRLVPVVGDPPLPSAAIRTLHVDRNGALWVGTYGGLSVLREGGFLTYNTEDGLVHDLVRVIHESADGTLWIGTYGGGLSRFREGSFVNYTTRDGLHSDAMYQILEDEQGDLWMSSNTGIFRVSKADLDGFAAGTQDRIESVVFDESDGMVMSECNGGFPGGYRSPDDGRLWFPTIAGAAVVDLSARPTRLPPPVVIERFSVDNEELPLGQEHVLPPGSRRVAFSFAALSFVAPEKTRFRYRLDGFDRTWVDAGDDYSVDYTGLRPGDYTFRVEASLVEGVWTGQEAGIGFTLQPAFYQTVWFIAACVLSVLSILWGLFRYRTRLMRVRAKVLEERVQERTSELEREISQRKQIEKKLEEANREAVQATRSKSEFLANMSHEVRTPMNGVLGMAQLMLDTPDLSSENREHAETVYASGEALLTIINDILDFSKIEAGKLDIEPIPFDLRLASSEVADLLAVRAVEKGLEILVRYRPDTPRYLIGDAGRVRQILMNLVGNAIKFTSDGYVLIEVEGVEESEENATVKISVQDTGIGMDDAAQSRLFLPFSQADSSTTRRFGGTGLGLSICKQLVELMGGEIGVESTPDEGSTFWFTLRLDRTPGGAPQAVPDIDLAGLRVLIVDDIEMNLRVLSEQLVSFGIVPEIASSGAEALERLRESAAAGNPFPLAILDYFMPEMDGEELGRAILADEALCHPALILLTSAATVGDGAHFEKAGFAGYLVKPTRTETLRDLLATVWVAKREGRRDTSIATRHSVAEARAVNHGPQVERPEGSRWRVLVAEDNIVNQMVAKRMLEKMGCVVDVVANGEEAVNMWSKLPYDIVFMDCQMPEMDGFEATRAIRNLEGGESRTPVIAMTANAMKGDREACLASGMDDYLAKPVCFGECRDALERWGACAAISEVGETR